MITVRKVSYFIGTAESDLLSSGVPHSVLMSSVTDSEVHPWELKQLHVLFHFGELW
jgi:hypothetical protein